MRFDVRTQRDAERALQYFNHFHDGFLEALVVRVIPQEPDFDWGTPVRYEVDLQLVHDNYPARGQEDGRQRRIALRFRDVLGLNVGNFVPLDTMLQGATLLIDPEGVIRFNLDGDSLVTFAARGLTIEEAADVDERRSVGI